MKGGIAPQNSKIEAIQKIQVTINSSQVKSFLGIVNYCHKFIPNYSRISTPLRRRLTKKNHPFVWGVEEQYSFDKLKATLSSAEIMAFYNPNAETHLIVDAGPTGLGAILSQEQEDDKFHFILSVTVLDHYQT